MDLFKEENQNTKIEKRLRDLELAIGVFNPRNMAGIRSKDLKAATRANLFGDGSDGNLTIDRKSVV